MLKQNFLRSLWLWMLFIVVGNVGAQNVAKIGTTEYATLQEAVAAVTDGTATTITMLADVDLAAALTVANTQNITLDLNGKTVKNEASKTLSQLITVSGLLTIDDNSAEKNGKIQNTASGKYVIKTGTAAAVLTLNNGTIETTTGNSNGAVYGTYGAFVMTGGKIIAAGTGVTSKNVNISGGQITATAGQALCAAGTITGGTFTSTNNNAVYANQSGTLAITGGEFTGVSTKPTINIYTADVKVTGATLNNGVGFASNATAMVLAGTDDAYLASTHAAFYDGETLVGYAPINTGLFASSKVSGKTVKLTKDVATTTNLNVTKSFALDLNNHNITCTPAKDDAAILTKGTTSAPVELTIKGEGKVSCGDHGEGCNAIQVGNCTTLNIEGGEFEVPGDNSTIYIITTANTEAAKSIVNISGGEFKSGDGKYVLNIKDDVRTYNTFNVTGGTFKGFDPMNNATEGVATNYTAEGYCTTNTDDVYTVVECPHVAAIGSTHYATLAAAVAAVPADGTATTITMLANVDLTATVATTYGQNVILDLNGKSITSTVLAIKNLGDLEVTGTGSITVNGTKNTLYGISNAGAAGKKANLIIGENVTVTAPCVAILTSYGKTIVNGILANTQADASNMYSTLRQNQTSSEVIVAESATVTGVVNAIFGDKGILEVNSTNVGKIYADGSATTGLKIKKTTAIESLNVYGHAECSDIADYYVAAKAISGCTGTVKLLSDINAALALSAGKTVTLDLNGHKVVAETYPIKVEGNLTITGEGTVQSTGKGSSTSVQAAAYVLNNGKLTIESGNYVAGYEGEEGNPAVYVRDHAVVEIKGGDFKGGSKFLLNKLDAYRETSVIEVSGGTFHNNFNPADNAAEGEHTNFVAEGYESVDNGDGTWTVKQILVSVDVPTTEEEINEVVTIENTEATDEEKTAANAAAKEALEELSENTAITSEGATNVAEQEDINILVITVKSATVNTTPASDDTPAQAIVTKVTYDVQPMLNGVTKEETDNLISFRLPVPANFSNTVKVGHQHGNNVTWTYEVVVGEGNQKYVELSSSLFSEWTVENLTGSNYVSIKYQNHNPVQVPVGNELAIDDNGEIENLTIASDLDNVNVTYQRDIKSSYQAWYVPFDYIITEADKENKIQFLKIWSLDIDPSTGLATDVIGKVLAPGERLKANTPYMVAAFGEPGRYTFTANGLKATAYNTISCTTTERAYTFNGTYMALDLANNPYWALSQSGVFNYWNSDAIENAMRFVMMIYDKESGSVIDPHYHSAAPVRVKIVGEDGVTETTGIPVVGYDDNVSGAAMHGCYDLSGRKINNPVSNGIYVINGKKCLK